MTPSVEDTTSRFTVRPVWHISESESISLPAALGYTVGEPDAYGVYERAEDGSEQNLMDCPTRVQAEQWVRDLEVPK